MTKEIIFEPLSLGSSFLVLNIDFVFLKEIVNIIVKLFSTICLVLCQIAPPDADNRTYLP